MIKDADGNALTSEEDGAKTMAGLFQEINE